MNEEKLIDNSNENVIDFLKDSITYSENRISLVDNKVGILITAQSIFFALLTFLIDEKILTIFKSSINTVSYIVLGGAFVILIPTILLLLQIIRPSKYFFGSSISIKRDYPKKEYIMWPNKEFPKSFEEYSSKIHILNISEIRKNYEVEHYITLQLVRAKYKYYRWAVVGMKILVSWSAIGLIVIASFKY